jgi:hypothetical protein
MSAPDWAAALAAVHDVSSVSELDRFGPAVLDALDGLIASDLSSFNEVDPLGGRAVVVSRPPEAVEPEGFAAWERWSHQHPALMHMLRSGDGSARRLSD